MSRNGSELSEMHLCFPEHATFRLTLPGQPFIHIASKDSYPITTMAMALQNGTRTTYRIGICTQQ